ncbi:MAG: NosD domain-containing protein [Candidatus Jacksonbacteria bacterium]
MLKKRFLIITLLFPLLFFIPVDFVQGAVKSIKDDATGGDCYLIGNWDVAAKICTLTMDITETIQIDSNNITFDGNGHTITGSTGKGVNLFGRTGVTIKNLNIKQFSYGIYLYSSSGNTLTNNIANSNTSYGISLYYGSNNNTLTDNTTNSNGGGIYLSSSNSNTLANNTASLNTSYGIYFSSSSNNTLTDNTTNSNGGGINISSSNSNTLTSNTMLNNRNNFNLTGASDSDFDNNIDTSNTVDGKPIYYVKNAVNQVYDSSTNAGTFYCIKCDNVIIKDLTFTKNRVGIFLWKTTNSKIEDIFALNNFYGIILSSSNGNTLTNNTADSNTFYGIILSSSNGNTLTNNTADSNDIGIYLSYSSNNTVTGNIALNNFNGIYFFSSSNNALTNNTAQENFYNDVYFYAWLDSHCDNTVTNTTGSGGRPIKYFNSAVSLSNETLSELILCNADGSSINNITIDGSSTNKNNGLYLTRTDSSTIANVNSSNNRFGINLYFSSRNTLTGNTATSNNSRGIYLYDSSNNQIYKNNFISNTEQVYIVRGSGNVFNLAAPIGGNYWSNFDAPSEGCSDLNNDNFCDSPYVFTGGRDNLPRTKQDVWKNQPPSLSYSQEINYLIDGVNPNEGMINSTPFIFKVIYADADNNPPSRLQVIIDGGFVDLSADNSAAPELQDGNYVNGEQYKTERIISALGAHSYYFEASDGILTARLPLEGELNFDVQTIDPLILKYEPILYFHPDEDFYPMNVEAFVENSSLWDSQGLIEDKLLKAESDENPVSLDDLTPQGQEDTTNWYLQFSQDLQNKTPDPVKAKEEYQAMVTPTGTGEAKNTYYARKMEDSYADEQGIAHNFTVLQYWYFYAFNDFGAKVEKGNNHEGDWETVMVFLDKDSEDPQFVAYSQHHNEGRITDPIMQYGSIRRDWSSSEVDKQGDQIISFTALGSHANYPNNGENGRHDILLLDPIEKLFFANYDFTSIAGLHLTADNWQNKEIFNNNDLPKWIIDYQGRWGVDYPLDEPFNQKSGARGPNESEYDKFNHPVQWAGIDKIGQKTITEDLITTVNFIKSNTKMVFDSTLAIGTKITADLHNEVISFGQNIQNLLLAPYFWDITSTLINNTFNTEVSFTYNPEEMQSFGITDLTKLTVFVYDETGQIWQEVPSEVDVNNNLIKFNATHFSRYAIGIKKIQKIQFQDITDRVKIVEDKKHYDKETGIQEINFKIKNDTEEEIKGTMILAIENLEEGVEFLNPDDLTSLTLIFTDLPEDYDLKGIDFTDSYRYCLFTGTESDIPSAADKGTKNKLLKEKPIKDKRCSEISSDYPELAIFLEDVLPAHKFTEDKTLLFKVPSKKEKKFDYEVRVWGEAGE